MKHLSEMFDDLNAWQTVDSIQKGCTTRIAEIRMGAYTIGCHSSGDAPVGSRCQDAGGRIGPAGFFGTTRATIWRASKTNNSNILSPSAALHSSLSVRS